MLTTSKVAHQVKRNSNGFKTKIFPNTNPWVSFLGVLAQTKHSQFLV